MSSLRVSEEDLIALKARLLAALGDGYEVELNKEVSALMGAIKETFELVIFFHGDAICGVRYKYKIVGLLFFDRFQNLYIDKLKSVGLKYGIEYYGDADRLYFWSKGTYKFESFSFDDMVIAIKGNQSCGARFTPSELCGKFSSFMSEDLTEELDCKQIQEIQSLFSGSNLLYDEKSASMWLKSEAEDDFFKILLNQKKREGELKNICRYTSLNSLFLTMRDGNQVMCSITCMNDKGETSYADKYIGYGAFANSASTIKENNDCFILSCCNQEMEDNLTMWRLYGNDGKGVCLEYDVDFTKIDEKEFFIAPVSYGKGIDDHPSLDFIRGIHHWRQNGWNFEFKRWYIWKHFFKSHLFKEEKEVRLLYVWTEKSKDKVEWIMDSTNSIVSRICKFPIKEGKLPLSLKKAIIGPKCPEQGSNVEQFNYMNRLQRTMGTSPFLPLVRASKIEDYR